MSREIELISVCMRSRESFETANDLLDWKDWTPLGVRIFNAIQDFYKRDPECKSADYRYVYEYATKSMSSEAQKEQARDVLQEAKGIDVSPGNVIAHAIELRRAAIGERLAESLCNGEHDHELFEEYTRLIETEDLSSLLGDELHDVELDDLMEVLDQKNKIKMYPKSLNDRITGGIVRGDVVRVSGRPNVGKTAFSVTNMAGMAYAGHKVLYCGNEDAIKKIIVRLVSCLTGRTAIDMMKDTKETMDIARQRGYNNIIFAYPVLTYSHISSLCRRHKPDVVFIDQVRNMKVKSDSRTNQLEMAGIESRNTASEHNCAVIDFTQAGESAEGKLKLSMSDVDMSKTGLQASCDIMIMIGADNAFKMNNSRMINLVKNKTGGVEDDPWTVKINPSISRYTDE